MKREIHVGHITGTKFVADGKTWDLFNLPKDIEFHIESANINLDLISKNGIINERAWPSNLHIKALYFNNCNNIKIINKLPNGLEFFQAGELQKLESIDLSDCADLEWLYMNGWNDKRPKLSFLDLSHCYKLKHIHCAYFSLTSIKFVENNLINFLSCNHNKLKSLDLHKLKNLEGLRCEDNKITGKLDSSLCPKLKTIAADIKNLDITNKRGRK